MDGYLTIDEAARERNCHVNTIRNYIRWGKLPNTFKKGHIVLILQSDLEALPEQIREAI